VVGRWTEGGQTVRAICRAEGVRESAFYFWRRKLAQRGCRTDAENGSGVEGGPVTLVSRSSSRMPSRHSPTPSFLPVRMVEPSVTEAGCGIEIALAHGRTVRVQAGFDRQTLADVLAVLEVRPC
jgi:transposase-like protein